MVVTTGKACKAPVKSSPPTNQHPTFYRPDALPVVQPTVSEHWMGKYHIPRTCLPKAHLRRFRPCLWPLKASDYLWKVAKPVNSHRMLVLPPKMAIIVYTFNTGWIILLELPKWTRNFSFRSIILPNLVAWNWKVWVYIGSPQIWDHWVQGIVDTLTTFTSSTLFVIESFVSPF